MGLMCETWQWAQPVGSRQRGSGSGPGAQEREGGQRGSLPRVWPVGVGDGAEEGSPAQGECAQ